MLHDVISVMNAHPHCQSVFVVGLSIVHFHKRAMYSPLGAQRCVPLIPLATCHVCMSAGAAAARSPYTPAAPSGTAAGTPVTPGSGLAPLPGDVNKMTVNELKAWVTKSRLEDEEFWKLNTSKARKPDWVGYVKRKLQQSEEAG